MADETEELAAPVQKALAAKIGNNISVSIHYNHIRFTDGTYTDDKIQLINGDITIPGLTDYAGKYALTVREIEGNEVTGIDFSKTELLVQPIYLDGAQPAEDTSPPASLSLMILTGLAGELNAVLPEKEEFQARNPKYNQEFREGKTDQIPFIVMNTDKDQIERFIKEINGLSGEDIQRHIDNWPKGRYLEGTVKGMVEKDITVRDRIDKVLAVIEQISNNPEITKMEQKATDLRESKVLDDTKTDKELYKVNGKINDTTHSIIDNSDLDNEEKAMARFISIIPKELEALRMGAVEILRNYNGDKFPTLHDIQPELAEILELTTELNTTRPTPNIEVDGIKEMQKNAEKDSLNRR